MHIIFDFDGTIADSTSLVRQHFDELAKKYSKKPVSFDDLRDHGMMHLIKKSGVSMLKVPKIAYELKQLLHTVVHKVKVYPQVVPVIKELSKKHTLIIVSSNSEQNIKDFLRRHELDAYFKITHSDSSLFGKDEVLKRLMRKHKLTAKQLIMIGDEDRDVRAAKKIGIASIATTWGYNSRIHLEKAEPDYITEDPGELLTLVETIAHLK
jgi:phosphoglycolate phosphatase